MTVSTLNLDARQRAMLDEMGVKVWWPMAGRVPGAESAAAAETAERVAEVVVAAPPAPVAEAPARPAVPASAAAPAARSPAGMAAQGAGILAEAPRRLHGGEGAAQGGWLIVADMPPEPDGRHGEPFAGDAGRLLANMLRALQLQGGAVPVHLMRTHRSVASGQAASPGPLREAFAEAAAELAPRIVLAMGPLAAQSLMQSGEPLGKLRGRVAPLAAVAGMQAAPVVATYHPAYLLRNPADKARAWADLCLAAEQFAR